MFEQLFTLENGIAFIALAAMEIVLGVDNLIYIAIVSARLPKHQQPLARRLGLVVALVTRLMLLFVLYYIVKEMVDTVFNLTSLGVPEELIERLSNSSVDSEKFAESDGISIKDMVLFFGGLFLVKQSVKEIHEQFSGEPHAKPVLAGFWGVVSKIAVMDVVFSLDSVITAVGMADDVRIMAAAIIAAMIVMILFANRISNFVDNHPTIKILALSFLILIGVMLVAEGIGAHLDKGYIYFAMTFALLVEVLNMRLRKKYDAIESPSEK